MVSGSHSITDYLKDTSTTQQTGRISKLSGVAIYIALGKNSKTSNSRVETATNLLTHSAHLQLSSIYLQNWFDYVSVRLSLTTANHKPWLLLHPSSEDVKHWEILRRELKVSWKASLGRLRCYMVTALRNNDCIWTQHCLEWGCASHFQSMWSILYYLCYDFQWLCSQL